MKGEPIGQPGVPESFNVLLKELQSLGLAVELLNEEEPGSAGLVASLRWLLIQGADHELVAR